jgi:PAS domain S-box-containing protein
LANAQAERLFGYSRRELEGAPVEMLLPEHLRARHQILRRSYFENPETRIVGSSQIFNAQRKDGQKIPVEIGLNTVVVEDTPVAVATIVDVAGHQRHEDHLATIIDTSGDAIISNSLTGTIMSWNPAAEHLFGYLADEIIGRDASLLIPPDRVDEERVILDRIKRGERLAQFETFRVAKDGRTLSVSLTISPIRSSGGEISGVSTIARDLTDHRHISEKLRLREARFQSIFDTVTDGIFLFSALDGTIIEVNRPGAAMFGCSRSELVGRGIEDLSSGEPPYTVLEGLRRLETAATTGLTQHFDWHCKGKHGRLFWASVSLRYSSIGGRGTIVAVARDVTEQRAHERRAHEARLAGLAAMRALANLTSRQREILDLIVEGKRNKNIAAALKLNQRTIENHRASIMKRTGAKSIPELIRLAIVAKNFALSIHAPSENS